MCGIYASISRREGLQLSNALRRDLENRGPDFLGTVRKAIRSGNGGESALHLTLLSTVLSLRGEGLTEQPLVSESTGSVLCWNGEAWSIGEHLVSGNDGAALLSALDSSAGTEATLGVLRSISGPFAFIYYDVRDGGRVYFGRDRLGRRSLLVHDQGEDFLLSSVSDPDLTGWTEVEADGIYSMDVMNLGDARSGPVAMSMATRYGWLTEDYDDFVSSIGIFNSALPHEDHQPLHLGSRSVQLLREQLVRSLSLRVLNITQPPGVLGSEVDTRVAVLFSGGLDCTVLARLASELVPLGQGIDLINVAFENPRVAAKLQGPDPSGLAIYEACPDRITGRKAFIELCSTCPERRWNFVSVNVPYSETQSHRSQVIALMHPHNTEMDLSIAYALYFAARGTGFAQIDPETTESSSPYTTSARVLLSGLGADELFGGYVRHTTAFSRRGYQGLLEELKLDVGRLGKRNLGRDDRAMSHWGREVRFPFLDEELVKWAIETPVWEKCDFATSVVNQGADGSDSGIAADKRVLRLLAEKLGMASVAREKKRAIQFGSRTAKMESGKVKGTYVISG